VAAAPPHPAAARVVTTFERLAGSGTAAALAALYAYEAQQPEVSRQKADGLRRHYGLADPGALAYFEVHAEADLAHRAGERRSLRRCLEEGADAESLIAAAEEALAAYWALLDGVCEEASLPAG
jgi:pyrroloquinoline quinone (PQQ) biosynthesis protein C